MVPKFQVATTCFSRSPPELNLSKLSSSADKATTIIFSKLYYIGNQNSEALLSQDTASKHSNALTFTLFLSEGRAGEAWETSYKMMLFPHTTIKCLPLIPGCSTFTYSFTFNHSLSCDPYDSHNKERLYPQTALTGWDW
jgi:hypothetical protein